MPVMASSVDMMRGFYPTSPVDAPVQEADVIYTARTRILMPEGGRVRACQALRRDRHRRRPQWPRGRGLSCKTREEGRPPRGAPQDRGGVGYLAALARGARV